MRILHVTDRLSARGGADWYLLGFIAELAARGHELALAVGRDDGSAAAPCEVVRIRGLDRPHGASAALPALDRAAGAMRPDVIHLHNAVAPEVLAWGAACGAVAEVQDHRGFCPGRGKLTEAGAVCAEPMAPATCAGCFRERSYFERIHAITEARRLALCDMPRLVVLSRYMRRELAAAGVPASRIRVIPPFVHGLDTRAEPGGPPCVAFVGRVARSKGVYDAAEAWRMAEVDLPLVFAGTGPERGRLEELGFEVTGWLGRPALSSLYRRARAVVMPSRWQEPYGIVGLEALAAGVPVAAWDSGGVREWHPGPLPAWGDVNGLARALRDAVTGPRPQPPERPGRAELVADLERVYADAARG